MESIINGAISEPEWLEKETEFWGFRVWHLIFFCFSGLLSVTIMLCCCFRFRIPRTKQEIEADFQRRKIAKKFRERLAGIKNSEMDDMTLQKALERIQQDFLADTQEAINQIQTRNSSPKESIDNNDSNQQQQHLKHQHHHQHQQQATQQTRPNNISVCV